jgi:hypothetical protein
VSLGGSVTLGSAVGLWGTAVVRRALDDANPESPGPELAREVSARATDATSLARWALEQPWPRFCAVVRIVTGDAAHDLMNEENDD